MARPLNTEQTEVPISPLGLAAVAQGANNDPELQALVLEFLKDELKKRKDEKERRLALARSAAEAAREQMEAIAARQRSCTHRDQANNTRLAGQRLSNGQVALVCQFCAKEFFMPPREGQEAPPRDLLPPADRIGGAMGE
jgi:hypothetical protein